MTTSLSDCGLYQVFDEDARAVRHGCDQEWYGTEWQRLSGCGPTTVCNLLWYLSRTRPAFGLDRKLAGKKDLQAFMEDVWQYVTPTRRGIPTTRLLYESALAYARARNLKFAPRVCDVPEKTADRPAWDDVVGFLNDALAQNLPVAFLNLCNGDEKELDPWHWVTVISLERATDGARAWISVLDGGAVKRSDLSLWFRTTSRGGGFVFFSSPTTHSSHGRVTRAVPPAPTPGAQAPSSQARRRSSSRAHPGYPPPAGAAGRSCNPPPVPAPA